MLRFLNRTSTILPVYQLLVFLNIIDATPTCVLVQLNRGLQLHSLFVWLVTGGWWLVLACSERKVLLAGCWWLVCSERKVLLAGC
jgi:hypothetical protein